jgi:hypothetical protein
MTTATYPSVPGVKFLGVPNFPAYCAGDDGSVWSCIRRTRRQVGRGTISILSDKWHKLKESDTRGYKYVWLCRDKKYFRTTVHKIVLETFVGPRPEGMEGCHFPDRDRSNNRLENLRWDTRAANTLDMAAHGTKPRGEESHASKLTESDVREVRRLASEGWTHKKICDRFGISKSAVQCVVSRKTWKHVE